MPKFKFLLYFCMLFGSLLSSASLTAATAVWEGEKPLRLDTFVEYAEDHEAIWSLDQVQKLRDADWQKLPEKGASFGLTQSAMWFRVDVAVKTNAAQSLYLQVDYPVLDFLEFYVFQEDRLIQSIALSDWKPFAKRAVEHRSYILPFELSDAAPARIYARVKTQGSMKVPMVLWEKDDFHQAQVPIMALYGAFMGILLVMGVYNLFLYASVRDYSYFFYSTLCFGTLGFNFSMDGLAFQWLWPNQPFWHNFSMLVFNGIACMSLAFFALFYLNPKPGSWLRKGLAILGCIPPLSLAMSLAMILLSNQAYQLSAKFGALMAIAVYGGSALLVAVHLRKLGLSAMFFLLAWSAFILGGVFKALSLVGVLPYHLFFEYSHVVGAVAGVVVLSYALADKIRTEREEKEMAQQQAIGNLKKFFSIYENAREGIFVLNMKGQFKSANPAMLEMLGVESIEVLREQSKGKKPMFVSDEDYRNLIDQINSTGDVVNHELQVQNLSGEKRWALVTARIVKDEHGVEEIDGAMIDIHKRKMFESKLQQLATYDALTEFYNRYAFEQRVDVLLKKIKANSEIACLLYLDLDQFKLVNDLCGHAAGDKLLQSLSIRIRSTLNKEAKDAVISRVGGDEFGVLLPGYDEASASLVAETLRNSVESFVFVWDGHRYPIGVSIGLVKLDPYIQSFEQVLAMADTACYMAKDKGRNCVHVFTETDGDVQLRKREMQWLSTLREAMEHDHFFLVAQAIQSNLADSGMRYEILLRLSDRQGGLASPGQFLPAAERYRMMPTIDRWVVETYFKWLRQHPAHLDNLESASINLSTQSLGEGSFAEFLSGAFEKYQIPPNKICFEITESMAITNMDNTIEFIQVFRKMGCCFSLDDFGTGFSSYAYLKDLQVDYVKVDGLFVRNLINNTVDEAMVKSVKDVASTMGIEVVAEFVETQDVQDRLVELGVHYSQGYHIQKPVPLEEIELHFGVPPMQQEA